ncbi:MAG: hypothetical protein OQK46_05705 [Gammaproteobacteria bacterium]|nr:hypothetical protein [Gammaproteobacteria bacterium]
MRFLTFIFLSSVIMSVSATSSSKDVSVYLLPKHKTYIGINKDGYNYVELLDNDGNLYVTFWEINETLLTGFKSTVLQCRKQIKKKSLFNKALDVTDINLDNVKPSLFKEFNLCIRDKGYIHKSSDAFFPGSYQVSLSRSHSSTDRYMPVGGSYHITKKNSDFKSVLNGLKLCVDKTNHKYSSESYEENSTYYSQVNIEPYANSLENCLKESAYVVNYLKAKKPNNTVKTVRDENRQLDELNSSFRHIP